MNILEGLKADPFMFDLGDLNSEEEVVRSVAIYDALPQPAIAISEVLSSDPAHVKPKLTAPAADGRSGSGPFGKDSPLKRRHQLRVSLTPDPDSPGELQEAAVTIVPVDPSRPPLYVAVRYRTKPSAYTLTPKGLTMVGGVRQSIVHRDIVCKTALDAARELQVLRKPSYTQVRILPNENELRIRIQVDLSKITFSRSDEILISAKNASQPVVRIPLRVISER